MHLSPTVVYHGVTIWYPMYHGDYGTYVLSRRGIPWYIPVYEVHVYHGIPWYDNMVPVCTMVPVVVYHGTSVWYHSYTMVYHGIPW